MLSISLVVLLLGQAMGTNSKGDGFLLGELQQDLKEMNFELEKFSSATAYLSWKLSTEPSDDLEKLIKLGESQIEWRKNWCGKLFEFLPKIHSMKHFINSYRENGLFEKYYGKLLRQIYLLCRGPHYNLWENRNLVNLLGKLGSIYENSKVCIENGTCFRGEPDLERIMTKSRNPEVLLWAWTEWRNKVGPPSREIYASVVSLLNTGAKNSGYEDIGDCWREELEVDDLENLAEELYKQIRPVYEALHAVVRYKLNKYYGPELVSLTEPIPAHLLGNMWAQNWRSLLDIITDFRHEQSLTYFLQKKNYTITDLVRKAEDFYISLGFRPMTEEFWKYSRLQNEKENGTTCHGTAANMFRSHDFRIILCAEVTEEDFSVIHHEMGHIAYYMEYENQPAIFKDGANSAFQESIGDAIMYGVVSPGHLYRLGLINDTDLTSEMEVKLLLVQALAKIPQIPFSLLLEKWRWDVFRGKISPREYNKAWWALKMQYQGVKSPIKRTEEHFDPSAKFHINDNKPYIRYFLSSILQMQIFEALCKASIYGEDYKNHSLPFPLHKCDIYGSPISTKTLRNMMGRGSSISWKEAADMVLGKAAYSVRPLLNYYEPVYRWLVQEIRKYNIPVGWN